MFGSCFKNMKEDHVSNDAMQMNRGSEKLFSKNEGPKVLS